MRGAIVVGLSCLAVLLSGVGAPTRAASPSFDCGRASAPIERLICSSEPLAALDAALGEAFRSSREKLDAEGRATALQEQRRWLQSRMTACRIPAQGEMPPDERGAAEPCLADIYKARIAALKSGPPPMPSPPAATEKAGLDRTLFLAKGRHEAITTIPAFGRYSIMVKSDQGTAVQLVDRMAGPGPVEGAAGHSDGRIDAFLDRGQYKVRLTADPRGSGDAELSVIPSVERNPEPQQLVELKPIATDLGDHEQRSWWLDVKERRFVAIEAAGRHLADIRLWRDGNWLVDSTPTFSERDAAGGEPLAIEQLAIWLEPGLYRLVAYGGPGEKWASGSAAKPLYLNFGIPSLPDADRALHQASPAGVDRWLVSGSATYFRIDIESAEHAVLSVQPYDPEHPFATGGSRAVIDKDNRDPKAELWNSALASDKSWLVTVERRPGARYRLQYFDDHRERFLGRLDGSPGYWLATLQAGPVGDALDPTAIVVRDGKQIVAESTLGIDPQTAWRRRFNLLDTLTLYLHADQPIGLVTEGAGVDADYRIEPFFAGLPPAGYHAPAVKPSGGIWQLDRGYWVLTIIPRTGGKGVLDLTLRAATASAPAAQSGRLPAPVFPELHLDSASAYMAYLSKTGERFGGAILQPLPLDLRHGTAFELAGGASLSVPVTVPEDGRLEAVTDDGKALQLIIDGRPAGAVVTVGRHDLSVTSPGGPPTLIAIHYTPSRLFQSAPLPPIEPARLAERPDFPMLVPNKPAFLDLAPNERTTFAVSVDQPALYRLETSGIIETEGAIRTRTVTALDKETANGIGRNFLIQQYLREGDYQLSVGPGGASYGPIGVAVTATKVADLGALEPEIWARATLSPGQAGRYRFHLGEAGTYRLQTLGLGHDFTMRLDDQDGWPILAPGSTADTTLQLDPGDYQIVLLPQSVSSRAVTLLHRIVDAPALSGHGPFTLALGETGRNRWLEPEKGAPRTPDRWTFSLPAEAEVTLVIDNGMRATLVQDGAASDKVALGSHPWVGTLPAGRYAVEVVSVAPDSRVDYAITVGTTELLAGQKRHVAAPARLPVSIGEDRQIELASYGGQDVKARLFDGAGTLVAANDDRDSDWNFLIATRLRPGRYTLAVDPVGTQSAATEVSLQQPDEVEDAAISLGKAVTIVDGNVHVLPLPEVPQDKTIVLAARASVPVGIAIEAEIDQHWETLGSAADADPYLALPNPAWKRLRARVWALDHGRLPVEVAIAAVTPAVFGADQMAGRGVTLARLDAPVAGLAAAEIRLKQPGALQLMAGAETVQWSRKTAGRGGLAYGVAHRDSGGMIVVAGDNRLFLIDRAANKTPITARLLDLEGTEPIRLVVHGSEELALPLKPILAGGDPVLWQVESQGGQPGVSIGADSGASPVPRMAVGPESPTAESAVTVATAPLDNPMIHIRGAGTDNGPDMPVTIRRTVFRRPTAEPAGAGIVDGTFAGKEAKLLTLTAGTKLLTLTLPPGAVGVARTGETVEQIVWAATPTTITIETAGDNLLLLNPSDTAAPYGLTIEPVAEASQTLAAGATFSRYSAAAGVMRLRFMATGDGTAVLRCAGAARRGTLVTDDGRSLSGAPIERADRDGYLDIVHDAGLIAVSADIGPQRNRRRDAAPHRIAASADVALSGPAMTLGLEAGPARLIHLTSDSPVILSSGESAAPGLFEAGADLDLVMEKDKPADLEIAPAGARALSGTLRIVPIDLVPIGEGLGPKRRLGPGQSRAFRFTLPAARRVGVGVRASVDVAESRLLGVDGSEIGRGIIHMHDLDAGSYVLVVTAPANGPAIDVEPALVGTDLPDRGPPESVKADYLALVGKQPRK